MNRHVIDHLEPLASGMFFNIWGLYTTKPLSVITTPEYWAKHHSDMKMRPNDRVEVVASVNSDAVENARFIVKEIVRSRARLESVSKLEAA
jgi:hypothetical protein